MAALVQNVPNATAPAPNMASSHPFTCNTCQVAFRSSDLQRTHMQSDWHRYNLKRRVASLPPLTSEIFAEKVLANKASAAATAARASFEKRCESCEKTYYSQGAYVNHLGSQKHRLLETRRRMRGGEVMTETESMADSTFSLGEPLETASIDTLSVQNGEDAEAVEEFEEIAEKLKESQLQEPSEPVPERPGRPTPSTAAATSRTEHPISATDSEPPSALPTPSQEMQEDGDYEHKADLDQCLFCNYKSPTTDLNLLHMGRQHGFFVPERDYLLDLPGLLTYLHETISVLHQCLYCHKSVHTTSGVQTHMRDRGHCMIAYGTEDEQMEVGEFYDFRSTYSDASDTEGEEQALADGGVSLGTKKNAKTTYQNDAGEDVDMDEDEEGWESDSSLSSVPTDEITSVPVDKNFEKLGLHRHHSHADSRPHKNTDGFHSHAHHTPHAVYHDDYELHLPSGRTAGHRSLKTYFRQNLRNYPSAEERAEQRLLEDAEADGEADDEDTESQVTQTNGSSRGRQVAVRPRGELGMVGVSDAKKREVKAVEKRATKAQQRAEKRYQWGNNKQSNFQKHFRDPLLQ